MRKPSYEIAQEELTLISQYLYHEMDEAAVTAFEKELQHNRLLQQKVEEVKLLLIGTREADLNDRLNDFHKDVRTSSRDSNGNIHAMKRWWWVAASVLVLAIAGIWWMQPSGSSNEQLYKNFFTQDIGLPVEMSNADSALYLLYDGMISYKEADYEKALSKWQQVTTLNDESDTLQYYSAIALMSLNKVDEAVAMLLPLSKSSGSVYQEKAVWYLALCHLRLNKRDEAIVLLKTIPENKQSQLLLKKLE
ncbi:tetratricopeptide repeat protein [Gynurincola endophyticus]|uniref:tetratricopeptide repeat protein n=1 Tax=Gynurincola endophyticus TaxID=2479004 RepID=UPI000F8DD4F2|nr:tetratricopeptide repeat protein [Gynurincola endophyticus]